MDEVIKLPCPEIGLTFPLMKALVMRRSKRKWQDSAVSIQNLSNLLWAACGITVKETSSCKSKRTAPSATNCQEIKIYVALESGLYLYKEEEHVLICKLKKDIRSFIGTQKMMQSAPVGLIFIVDYSRMKLYLGKDENRKLFVAGTDTGFISQNIYLYCAASNLSTVILGLVNREELGNLMLLGEHEKVMYTQIVGNSVE